MRFVITLAWIKGLYMQGNVDGDQVNDGSNGAESLFLVIC